MRLWTAFLALGLAAPVLAQQGTIEVQPLDPLIAPGATPERDGGILVRPVEPLGEPAAPEGSDRDLLGEGFNEDAFGSDRAVEEDGFGSERAPEEDAFDEEPGSFIDRAFGTAPRQQDGPRDAREPELWSEGPLPEDDRESDSGWFGLDSGAREDPLSDANDGPRFESAPFTTRNRYESREPAALPQVATVPMEGAEIRQLDKMTGATRTVAIKAGQEQRLGRLRVRVEGCHAPADGGDHGTRAFLRVWDPEQEVDGPAFSGWMFADSPALSALDHPRYDVWILGCTPTRAAETAPAGERDEG